MSTSHSLSRDLQSATPTLLHSLHEQGSSVLSLAANDEYIFSGSQSQDISVWCKRTFQLKDTLRGHTGSVLALECANDKKWLFSSSGDSTVRIWSTESLTPIYVLDPYLETGAGDLFSLVWSSTLQTIYIGCQNTSLQWFDFHQLPTSEYDYSISTSTSGTSTPRKAHKFFDSYPQYQHRPADIHANNGTRTATPTFSDTSSSSCITRVAVPSPQGFLHVPVTNVIDSAHYGYVYCMALIPSPREGSDDPEPKEHGCVQLVTGSGDESVKLWDLNVDGPELVHTFQCAHGAILALVARRETVYAGCQDGFVKVFDLETKTLVRTIIVQENIDILSLSMMNSDLYTCSANGQVQRWSASFDCTASWSAHDNGIVLSSIITRGNSSSTNADFRLVTGGNDDYIKVWEVIPPKGRHNETTAASHVNGNEDADTISALDTLTFALCQFVSFPSVSSSPSNKEDCRQAAIWLKNCLSQLGASQSTLFPTSEHTNPLVFATFKGTQGDYPKRRVLFYGHYDVMSAPSEGWISDPFKMTGRNGYLYGRGVTDDKGPIMAVACAAAELLTRRALGIDLIFLIEGEEECGSVGFGEAFRKHKDLIGHVDAILVSNSTWIAEDPPCITYGLRGVVHCSIEISSNLPDLHSGIEGGSVSEPMLDMVKLLATLSDRGHVQIHNFYEHVRPQTEEEQQLYRRLSAITQRPPSSIAARWHEPSLTVHNIEVSGPKNATVIPGNVTAQLSLRIVPDQDLDTIVKSLCDHLNNSFQELQSPNNIQINVEHTADWWLGNLDDPWFKALEGAVQEEWGVEPLRIREGGSIPSVPFLEKELGCHALHLPMGQSSDQAHLPNERISLNNLHRGKSVIERFLLAVADKGLHDSSAR